jgi:hypothetical protein
MSTGKLQWSVYNDTAFIPPLRHPASGLIPEGLIPEDAFDLPLSKTHMTTYVQDEAHAGKYSAEYTHERGATLVFYPPAKIIAKFETLADAQTAAKALNEHKGY